MRTDKAKEAREYDRFMSKNFPVDKVADALEAGGSISAAAEKLLAFLDAEEQAKGAKPEKT